MKRVLEFLKEHKYLMVLLIIVGFSVTLGLTYSNFIVTSNNHKAAEMYIGALKYSIEIDGSSTNTLSVPTGETIIDVKVNNLNPVDTYYKLLYLNNSNLEIKYFSETKDTDEVKTNYKSPNDNITSGNTNSIKLLIINNSTTSKRISFSLKGGYINNKLSDISIPSGYSEITTLEISSSNTYFCETNNALIQGLEYINGQYTYKYMQEGTNSTSGLSWSNITTDGWGVQLTDKTSTSAVTSKLCTYINNKPITSYSLMFNNSKATILDVSNFDTSKVTDMGGMFQSSQATTLDLSSFDTSKVTNMRLMFSNSQAKTLDLSSFDTSKVTNMTYLFYRSKATTLDLSSFDTSKVTDMSNMFYDSKATTLDLSNFDTSKVTGMSYMFYNSQVITLDMSSFDTSKVTNMSRMFQNSQVTTLDLSSFDTSKVTSMNQMFYNSTKIKTIYVSDKFNIDAVTSSTNMFYKCTSLVGGSGTVYDSSKIDKTYAKIDGGTSNPGYFTDIANKPSEPNSFSTDSWPTIINAVKNNNISKYNVGDTRTIDMGTYGTHTLRIANTSTPSECSRAGFSQSACGFVLEFADIITTHNMNPTGTYNGTSYIMGWNKDGWPASSMYTFVNNDIYNAIPSEIKNAIIDTTVVSGHGAEDTKNFTSTDKLYLLAPGEIYSDWSTYQYTDDDIAKDLTRTLDYYTSIGVTTSIYSGAIKNNGTNAAYWWLRTASSSYTDCFFSVDDLGIYCNVGANSTSGVSPAFRIG